MSDQSRGPRRSALKGRAAGGPRYAADAGNPSRISESDIGLGPIPRPRASGRQKGGRWAGPGRLAGAGHAKRRRGGGAAVGAAPRSESASPPDRSNEPSLSSESRSASGRRAGGTPNDSDPGQESPRRGQPAASAKQRRRSPRGPIRVTPGSGGPGISAAFRAAEERAVCTHSGRDPAWRSLDRSGPPNPPLLAIAAGGGQGAAVARAADPSPAGIGDPSESSIQARRPAARSGEAPLAELGLTAPAEAQSARRPAAGLSMSRCGGAHLDGVALRNETARHAELEMAEHAKRRQWRRKHDVRGTQPEC